MAKNLKKLARLLGADVVAKVPDPGGGAFGAARLARILQARLEPSRGKRPGRPTAAGWSRRPKIPMSAETQRKLHELARLASTDTRKMSAMQVAAQLLEEAVERCMSAKK